MKSFTHTQKKWAMSAALLLALGFNFSYNNKHSYGVSSMDFASTDEIVEGKLTTSAGVATVKYVKVSDKKVLAIRPQIVEGKFCDTCANKTTEIDASFGKEVGDIDKLNVALLKQMEDEGRVKPAPKPSEERSSEVVNSRRISDKDRKEKKDSWTATALKNCEGRNSRSDSAAEVNCRLTEITTALRSEEHTSELQSH